MSDDQRGPDENLVDWALRTRRIAGHTEARWRERAQADPAGSEHVLNGFVAGRADLGSRTGTAPTAATAPAAGDDVVSWAVATGRLGESRAGWWRAQLASGAVSAEQLRALTPVPLDKEPAPARSRQPLNLATVVEPTPTTDAYARNPLLDAARARDPQSVAAASRRATAPTLFGSGDLPPFTASGIDPSVLLRVPWQARHPVAAAPTTAAAFRLVEVYGDRDTAAADAAVEFGPHPGNVDYQTRVKNWLVGGLDDAQLYDNVYGPA